MASQHSIILEDDRLLIRISPADFPLPKTMLQGTHQHGALVNGETVTPWDWHGFSIQGDSRYIYADRLEVYPLTELFDIDEQHALKTLEALGKAIDLLSHTMPESAITSTFSLDDVLLLKGGGFLFLPPSVTRVIENAQEEGELYEKKTQWTNPKYFGTAGIVYELTVIAYRILTGESPIASSRVRNDSYQAVPIELIRPDLNPSFCAWFNTRLSRKPALDETISQWVETFSRVRSLPCSTDYDDTSGRLAEFIAKQEKRSRRKESLRIHSVRNIIVGIVLLTLVAIGGSAIHNALKPPLTAGMSPEEVARFYYDCHNRLDTVSMSDALDRGVKSASESSLTYLYITTTVRQAYEHTSGFIPAQQWIDEGMPDVDQSTIVYGITDLTLTPVDEDTLRASYLLWNPVFPDEGEIRSAPAIAYRVEEELDFRQKGDHWLITAIRRDKYQEVD